MAKVDITPDVSLIGKLGARSRQFPNVVTELVDNSLDSWWEMKQAGKNPNKLAVVVDPHRQYFLIKDNAGGMTYDELKYAMTVAHSDKKGREHMIGSYGMGLKSAVMYIGDSFEIYTKSFKEKGKKKVHYVHFDKNKFEAGKEWKLDIKTISDDEASRDGAIFEESHGTFIRIENKKYKPGLKNGIIKRLRRVFAPMLPVNPHMILRKERTDDLIHVPKMELRFGSELLSADGPFYSEYQTRTKTHKEQYLSHPDYKGMQSWPALIPDYKVYKIPKLQIGNKTVEGRIGLVDRSGVHRKEYGFDLITNGRVIESSVMDSEAENEKDERIGFRENNFLARVVGQLVLQGWEVDHQKTCFIQDNEDDWKKLAEHIKYHFEKSGFKKISSKLQNPGGQTKQGVILDKGLDKKKIRKVTSETQRTVRSPEFRAKLNSVKNTSKDFTRIDTSEASKNMSDTKIIQTKPKFELEKNGSKKSMVRSKVLKHDDSHYFQVFMNIDHPFFGQLSEEQLNVVAPIFMLDSFAEYIAQMKGLTSSSSFLELRDELLRKYKFRS